MRANGSERIQLSRGAGKEAVGRKAVAVRMDLQLAECTVGLRLHIAGIEWKGKFAKWLFLSLQVEFQV